MNIFKFFLIFAALAFVESDEENEDPLEEKTDLNPYILRNRFFSPGSFSLPALFKSLPIKETLEMPFELLKFPELLEFFKNALTNPLCGGLPKPTNMLAAKALFILNFLKLAQKDSNYCVYYDLFTQRNKDNPETIENIHDLRRSKYFKKRKLSMFVFHGWTGSSSAATVVEIKNEALKYHDVNVFLVDWSRVSVDLYVNSRNHVKDIGIVVSKFIKKMMEEYNLDGSSILPVGFSLGGHIVGVIGSKVRGLERIVSLDPAGPLFQKNSDDRLKKKHAKLVEVIHTSAGRLGHMKPFGHIDFYPNGGKKQPGCNKLLDAFGSCHHQRSVNYFAESLRPEANFSAVKCDDFETFLTNKRECSMGDTLPMGQLTKKAVHRKAQGTYFLETGSDKPYFKIDSVVRNKNVYDKLEEHELADKNFGGAMLKLEEAVGDLGDALKFFEMVFLI